MKPIKVYAVINHLEAAWIIFPKRLMLPSVGHQVRYQFFGPQLVDGKKPESKKDYPTFTGWVEAIQDLDGMPLFSISTTPLTKE